MIEEGDGPQCLPAAEELAKEDPPPVVGGSAGPPGEDADAQDLETTEAHEDENTLVPAPSGTLGATVSSSSNTATSGIAAEEDAAEDKDTSATEAEPIKTQEHDGEDDPKVQVQPQHPVHDSEEKPQPKEEVEEALLEPAAKPTKAETLAPAKQDDGKKLFVSESLSSVVEPAKPEEEVPHSTRGCVRQYWGEMPEVHKTRAGQVWSSAKNEIARMKLPAHVERDRVTVPIAPFFSMICEYTADTKYGFKQRRKRPLLPPVHLTRTDSRPTDTSILIDKEIEKQYVKLLPGRDGVYSWANQRYKAQEARDQISGKQMQELHGKNERGNSKMKHTSRTLGAVGQSSKTDGQRNTSSSSTATGGNHAREASSSSTRIGLTSSSSFRNGGRGAATKSHSGGFHLPSLYPPPHKQDITRTPVVALHDHESSPDTTKFRDGVHSMVAPSNPESYSTRGPSMKMPYYRHDLGRSFAALSSSSKDFTTKRRYIAQCG
ncbi:unnamed protein product [Amoebophrya sp. A25]|nr:unnamed protein product [Amoebophrya sp. A25]|eukprot:GSA25T00025841001.1